MVFLGMLRFHVFKKLTLNTLVLVGGDGREYKMKDYALKKQNYLILSNKIMGFFFNISNKFHPATRVYLPKLEDKLPKWKPFCPLRALKILWVHALVVQKPFSRKNLTKSDLILAMKQIDLNNRDFKSHSLRIGAHTFFLTYGLPVAFVEFFSTSENSKSSTNILPGFSQINT